MMLGAVRSTCGPTAGRSIRGGKFPVQGLFFSTDGAAATARQEDEGKKSQKQEFVTTTLHPQDWDKDYKDPLFRPKFRSSAKVLSRHDVQRINGVTFEDQFANFESAGMTLSWLDNETQNRIYTNYVNWMKNAQEKYGKTSHEYVCRVLAQKFHITPHRAAAIIVLKHNEEQLKIQHPEDDIGNENEIMDIFMKNTIETAYRSTGEDPPESFVEPIQFTAGAEHPSVIPIPDLIDVDQLTIETNHKLQERATVMINDHPYTEDIDDSEVKIPMCKDSMNLIKMKDKLKKEAVPEPKDPSPAASPKRQNRWSFVCQAIDTRLLNPKIGKKRAKDGRKLWGKRYRNRFHNNWAENTLIEEDDGTLRPANLAEVRNMSWKPIRHHQEHTYATLKQAWLEKIKGNESAWGFAPKTAPRKQDDGAESEEGEHAANNGEFSESSLEAAANEDSSSSEGELEEIEEAVDKEDDNHSDGDASSDSDSDSGSSSGGDSDSSADDDDNENK